MMNFRRSILSSSFTLGLAAIVAAVWLGCNNHAAPPSAEKRAQTPPPIVHTGRVDPTATILALAENPPAQRPWQAVPWITLSAPLDSTRTPPTTRVATLYDDTTLYVAFVCTDSPPPPSSASTTAAASQDAAEVWLDTSAAQDGTEVLCMAATSAGQVSSSWYRFTIPPQPKEDGSPDASRPASRYGHTVAGLQVKTGRTTLDGHAAWTAVFAIPLTGQALPTPLRPDPRNIKEGTRWKINCIRSDYVQLEGDRREFLQAHLSPVYQGCQQLSPYRMAQLVLEGPMSVALQPVP